VGAGDRPGALEVGDRPGDFQAPVEGSNRKPEPFDGGLENSPRRWLERNPGIELGRRQVRVAKTFAPRAPGRRAPSDAGDAFSNRRRRLFRAPLQIRPRDGRDRDVKVDPVEQRSGEFSSVTRSLGEIAAAGAARIAGEAARAGQRCLSAGCAFTPRS
jgi:hypothetical protein